MPTAPTTTRVPGARPFLAGMFVDALGNGLYVPLTLRLARRLPAEAVAVPGA